MSFVHVAEETTPPPDTSEVAHLEPSGASPATPTSTHGGAKRQAYILITLKTTKEAPGTDLSHTASPRKQVNRAMSVPPYYREAVSG